MLKVGKWWILVGELKTSYERAWNSGSKLVDSFNVAQYRFQDIKLMLKRR